MGPRPGVTGQEAKRKITKEEESKWILPEIEPLDWEIKLLIARAVQIGVKVAFSNYLYTFGGKTFRQAKGGPIGSRLTMAISRIIMGRWSHHVWRAFQDSNIPLYFLSGYVDDIRLVLRLLANGQYWDNKERKFVIDEGRKISPEEWTNEARILNTRQEVGAMMCSVFSLEFTTEVSSDFPNNILPTLDTEIWMSPDGTIFYSFFRKPISTLFCVRESSASPTQQKLSIMTQKNNTKTENNKP